MSIRRGKGRSPLLKRPVESRDVARPVAHLPAEKAIVPAIANSAPEIREPGVCSVEVLSTQVLGAEARSTNSDGVDVHHAKVSAVETFDQERAKANVIAPAAGGTAADVVVAKPTRPIGGSLLADRKRRSETKPQKAETVDQTAVAIQPPIGRTYWTVVGIVTGILALWLFGPTLRSLVHVWNTEPDYSHGYLVAPFAVLMLWIRRETMPAATTGSGWGGLALLAAGFALRFAGERLFLTPLSGWALVLWLAGACWLLAGWRQLAWALPVLGFLAFMIPLPFRAEQLMSWHLQTLTTQLSTFLFECLGQSAVAEGHTVFVGDHVLEIEQACSGLRMFMGIGAIAYGCVVLQRRSRLENSILIAAIAPVAMLSNAIRVVVTGFLMPNVAGAEAEARLSHDGAGWMMIVVAVAMFALLIAYLRKLFVAVDES